MRPRTIALFGTSGAGKTTLGRQLARRIGGTFVEVDAIRHKAGWVEASDEELRAGIGAALDGQERWVIDSTCERRLGDFVSARAELIVWLDLPLATKLVRLCRRSWRRVRTREELWNGNVERWHDVFVGRDSVLVHAVRSHVRDRRAWAGRRNRDQILRLRSVREVERWLEGF